MLKIAQQCYGRIRRRQPGKRRRDIVAIGADAESLGAAIVSQYCDAPQERALAVKRAGGIHVGLSIVIAPVLELRFAIGDASGRRLVMSTMPPGGAEP